MRCRQSGKQPGQAQGQLRDNHLDLCRSIPADATGSHRKRRAALAKHWHGRWQIFGLLVLLVAHTVGQADDGAEVLRIIAARKAEPKERKRYEQDRQVRA